MITRQAYPLWVRINDGDKSAVETVIAWSHEEGKWDKPVPVPAESGEVPTDRVAYFLSTTEEVAGERAQIRATREALNPG